MSSINSSASTSSAYSSDSRITSLFSNLDTDSIVKSMCSNQQSKVDKQEQNKTSFEWLDDALSGVVDSVNEFSNTYCSALGSSSMLKASTYYAYDINTTSTSKAVTLTASGDAALKDYTVKVNTLAENANAPSAGKVSKDGTEISSSNTATLSELSFANELTFNSSGKISFSINGKQFTFAKDTTLQNMISTINADSTAKVTMKYSRLTDKFTVTADSGGKDSSVTIKNISGNAFGANSAFQIDEGTKKNGCDAEAVINGTTVTKDSNEFTIDGVSYELNKVTKGTTEETMDFTVDRNYSTTVSSITTFVDAFNKLITKLNDLSTAKDYSDDYPPLTDAQKEDMSDDEIKNWETKAKSGILHNNSDLKELIANLKDAFFSKAGGTGKTAASIGISTGSYFGTDKGLLVIDSKVLTSALESDPDSVVSLFTGGSSTSASADQGVMYKIKAALSSYKSTTTDTITNNEDKIDDTEKDIKKLNTKLKSLAERYYDKFSAMETALSKLNSQASYISQLFSS